MTKKKRALMRSYQIFIIFLASLGIIFELIVICPNVFNTNSKINKNKDQIKLEFKDQPANPMDVNQTSEVVNPNEYHANEPAPMGIADYGITPSNGSAYWYSTTSFEGIAAIASLSTNNGTGYRWASFQLNVVTYFQIGSNFYAYWLQDVMQINTLNNYIDFLDNVWNFSSPSAEMSGLGISGSGQVAQSGSDYFYYDFASASLKGNQIDLSYPSTVNFQINSTLDINGRPVITFSYNDGYNWQTYDRVTFLIPGNLTNNWNLLVDGQNYAPNNLFFDSELILGGVSGGANTTDVSSNINLFLYYYNGNNFQTIPVAYNFGSNTAEGISNVITSGRYYLSDGNLFMQIINGAGTLGDCWDQSTTAVGSFSIPGDTIGGSIIIGNASGTISYHFQFNSTVIILFPGNYSIQIMYNGTTQPLGSYIFSPNSTTYIMISIFPLPNSSLSGPSGTLTGSQLYTYHGSWVYTGATGTLELWNGTLSIILASGLNGTAINGTYLLNTTQYSNGLYLLIYIVTTPYLFSNQSNISIFINNPAPATPLLHSITPNPSSSGNITLSWDGVSGQLNGYYVYCSLSNITTILNIIPIGILDPTVTTYTDYERANGTYHYVIVAYNNGGRSNISNEELVIIALPVPKVPILELIVPNPSLTGNITISWSSIDNALGYYLFRTTTPITTTNGLIFIANLSVSVNQYTDYNLTNGQYYYALVAFNYGGNSSFSIQSVVVSLNQNGNFTTYFLIIPFVGVIIVISIVIVMKKRRYNSNTNLCDIGSKNSMQPLNNTPSQFITPAIITLKSRIPNISSAQSSNTQTPIGEIIYCVQCGAPNQKDSQFCEKCGNPIHI